jgi:hypothetical protein
VQQLEERLNILLLEFSIVKNLLEDLCELQTNKMRIPHRCPVCNGGYDDNETLCHPCDGNGIVWG